MEDFIKMNCATQNVTFQTYYYLIKNDTILQYIFSGETQKINTFLSRETLEQMNRKIVLSLISNLNEE